jgi:hypothetical protein
LTPDLLLERWGELSLGRRGPSGMGRRRLDAEAAVDVYACVFSPLGRSGLLIQGGGVLDRFRERMPRCRGVRVSHEERDDTEGRPIAQITVVLEEERLRDIFAVLAADLINAVIVEPSAPLALRRCVDRLCMWQGLFERLSPEGLSEERQRGLFGELIVLNSLVMQEGALLSGVSAWTGAEAHHQDFITDGIAIEVKTTLAKRHARIAIANERQLDERPHEVLILASVRLEESVTHGSSLPGTVAELHRRLSDEELAARLFDTKLLMADYLDIHSPYYEARRYRPAAIRYYQVGGNFPRLTEANLPGGVGDIRYSIIADDLGSWEVSEAEVRAMLKNAQ